MGCLDLLRAVGAALVAGSSVLLQDGWCDAGAAFDVGGPLERLLGLPGRSAKERDALGIFEHLTSLLERLSGRLREEEEDVNGHGKAEGAENAVSPPLNALERGWHKVSEGEVEDPIPAGGERDGLATLTHGVEFRWINPRDRAPGWSIGGDEKIRTGDQGVRRRSGYGVAGFRLAVETAWRRWCAVNGEYAGIGEHPDCHEDSADQQSGTTSPTIDVEKGRNGHDHVDDVLNGGREEQSTVGLAGHEENVGDVVHHHVHASELGPDLGEQTNVSTVDHPRLEQVKVGDIRVGYLELDHGTNLLHFVVNQWIAGVAVAVNESDDGLNFFPATLAGQPARGLGGEEETEEENDRGDHL